MPKGKSAQEKAEFVKDNLHLVPAKSKEQFPTWNADKQYKNMVLYVSKSKKLNITEIVDSITKKNPTSSDVEKIIAKLQDWVNNSTTRRIEELKKKQEKIAKELKELTGE